MENVSKYAIIKIKLGELKMKYTISGSVMQALEIQLDPGERVFTEKGAMVWMRGDVKMDSNLKGGLFKSLGRMFSGESLTLNFFEAGKGGGYVGFAPMGPGKVIPLEVKPGRDIICQRDAFMVAEDGVDVSIHFQKKLGAGFFGGEGFIMQRLSGQGMAFAEIDGEVVEFELSPGEIMRVDTSHLAIMESSVEMDIEFVKGVKNMFLGGEGLFLTRLEGPGKVWLQTLTIANLAGKIAENMPQND